MERASGKTIRSLLSTALKLSEGKKLVIFTGDGRTDHKMMLVHSYMRQLSELTRLMGFHRASTAGSVDTVNGGMIRACDIRSMSHKGYRFDEEVTNL